MLAPGDGGPFGDAFPRETCLSAAGDAILAEDWADAEAWLRRARDLDPLDGEACADLAFVLTRLGRPTEAVPLFEEARRLGVGDAETFLEAARAALAAGRPLEDAEAWLLDALERSPTLVVDVEEDFDDLRGWPALEEALERAWGIVLADDFADDP